jgi:hypothetical protein
MWKQSDAKPTLYHVVLNEGFIKGESGQVEFLSGEYARCRNSQVSHCVYEVGETVQCRMPRKPEYWYDAVISNASGSSFTVCALDCTRADGSFSGSHTNEVGVMEIRKAVWKDKFPSMVADGPNGSTFPEQMMMAEWDAAKKLADQKGKNAHINEEGAGDMSDLMADERHGGGGTDSLADVADVADSNKKKWPCCSQI